MDNYPRYYSDTEKTEAVSDFVAHALLCDFDIGRRAMQLFVYQLVEVYHLDSDEKIKELLGEE